MTGWDLLYLAAGTGAIVCILAGLFLEVRELVRWAAFGYVTEGDPPYYHHELPPRIAGARWWTAGIAALVLVFLSAALLR